MARFNDDLDFDMSGSNRSRIVSIKENAREGIAKQLNVKTNKSPSQETHQSLIIL